MEKIFQKNVLPKNFSQISLQKTNNLFKSKIFSIKIMNILSDFQVGINLFTPWVNLHLCFFNEIISSGDNFKKYCMQILYLEIR